MQETEVSIKFSQWKLQTIYAILQNSAIQRIPCQSCQEAGTVSILLYAKKSPKLKVRTIFKKNYRKQILTK